MPRVTCRCGEKLKVPPNGPERIDCPKCGARIRLRRSLPPQATATNGDDFVRFHCPCGRRLKVSAIDTPAAGRCPDCGRVVPVPAKSQVPASSPGAAVKRGIQSDPDGRTEEMDADDLARLEKWEAHCAAKPNRPGGPLSTATGVHVLGAATGATPPTAADSDMGFATPMMPPPSAVKFETGLRVCPRCKKPVHLGAAACRECGTPVPRSE